MTAARNMRRGAMVVEELVRLGARCFCVAPGARSTPLALAIARHEAVRSVVHADERAMAFYALGNARATGKPAVVVTTSGTAVGNLMPAVMEADRSGIPLVLLTADRPHELRGSGANQTLDQVKCFGDFVRSYTELPLSDEAVPERAILAALDRAWLGATGLHPGPVHVDLPLRKPLGTEAPDLSQHPSTAAWFARGEPAMQLVQGVSTLSVPELQGLCSVLGAARRPLLVVGSLQTEAEVLSARRIARSLGWPLVADVTSGLRLDAPAGLLAPIDRLLASPAFARLLAPDVVLHLGGAVVSRRYTELVGDTPPERHIVVSRRGVFDPAHTVTDLVVADLEELSFELERRLPAPRASNRNTRLLQASRVARQMTLPASPAIHEPGLARTVSLLGLPVFVGSSMPVRDLDDYAAAAGPGVPVGANRGVSGIDGTLATALGWGDGLGRRVVVFLGDQALVHDLGTLVLAARHGHIVVVCNNGGGGIFSKLPVAATGQAFESHFAAAHEATFAGVARAMGMCVGSPESLEQLDDTLRAAKLDHRPTLIEVRTERAAMHALRQAHEQRLVAAVEDCFGARSNVVALAGGAPS